MKRGARVAPRDGSRWSDGQALFWQINEHRATYVGRRVPSNGEMVLAIQGLRSKRLYVTSEQVEEIKEEA